MLGENKLGIFCKKHSKVFSDKNDFLKHLKANHEEFHIEEREKKGGILG